jgi:hypothetical protein
MQTQSYVKAKIPWNGKQYRYYQPIESSCRTLPQKAPHPSVECKLALHFCQSVINCSKKNYWTTLHTLADRPAVRCHLAMAVPNYKKFSKFST